MRNLLEFLAKYYHWFLFVVLEIVSMVLLFQYNSYQGSVWFSSANVVAGKVYDWNASIESFLGLVQENEVLTTRNVYLERQVKQLSEKLVEATKDSSFMKREQLEMLSQYKLIPAKVVDNSIASQENLITIDKGSADGVRKDMGVACGSGIVGIVYMVSANYSVVIPVINSHSNISVAIENRGYFGYLQWKGGASNIAYVEDIPRHAHFRLYDKVVTSGYSSVFPPGLLVGKILHVYNSADGLSYRLQVQLSTDFGILRNVCVIDDTVMQERLKVLRAAQDSLKVKE
ncbi:MAG: rod shape-determining protein MreC [Prevotella sp.]|nr:rod shape-determining protein MreC [Prevotella sp.]